MMYHHGRHIKHVAWPEVHAYWGAFVYLVRRYIDMQRREIGKQRDIDTSVEVDLRFPVERVPAGVEVETLCTRYWKPGIRIVQLFRWMHRTACCKALQGAARRYNATQ